MEICHGKKIYTDGCVKQINQKRYLFRNGFILFSVLVQRVLLSVDKFPDFPLTSLILLRHKLWNENF